MRRRLFTVALIMLAFVLIIPDWIGKDSAQARDGSQHMIFPSLITATPTPTHNTTLAHQTPPASSEGINPTILAALITSLISIIVALITGGFLVFQTIYNSRTQKRREQEMERLRRELDEQYKARERDTQRKAADAEAIRHDMLLAQSNNERAQAYRRALHSDPRISRIQILDMSRPLEIINIYVRLRVHEDTRRRYQIDPLLSAAEMQRDPNALLRAGRLSLERRISTSIDPDEAIRKYTRCVIVGDPGAGKTTLLNFLTLQAADGALKNLPDLPIHISMNAFAASSTFNDLLEFAANEWDEHYAFFKAEARNYMEEMLKKGKALLLLDALDETVIGGKAEEAEASYKRISDAIIRLATRFPLTPIVVTVRKAGYLQMVPLVGFTELEVLDFRLEEMQQFVNKWFASLDYYNDETHQATNAADLNTKLERNPRIQALASNPLLLSLIVLVYQAQLDLPERRSDLYKRCIDVLLTEWDAKRVIRRRREFKPEQKQRLLVELAWHFHLQGRRYFPEHELLAQIANFLPALGLQAEQNESVLKEIANENGLLKEQARGWYGFLHLTLQEFFVAQYVNDHDELVVLLTHVGDPWWEEVLLLYAGQVADASPLFEALLGQPNQNQEVYLDDLFHTNLIMAGRCLAASPTIRQSSLREQTINHLFEIMTTTPYSLTRKQAAEALAEIGGTAVTTRLLSLLSNEQVNLNVRGSIALALGAFGERTIGPDLLRLLEDERLDLNVRGSIALALGAFGERLIIPDLLRLLGNKQVEWYVRANIASALGALGQRSVAQDLLRLLSDKHLDVDVSKSIALALGTLGEQTAIPDLLRLLSDEQLDLPVRGSIAETLGKLGERAIARDLLQLLEDEKLDLNVRGSIALTLGTLMEPSVAFDLLRVMSDKQVGWYVRANIAQALGTLGEQSVIPDLLRLLNDKQVDLNVYASVTSALGILGERTVAQRLLQLLGNELIDVNVRKSIALALGTLGDRSITTALFQMLGNEQIDVEVRGSISSAIGHLGEEAVVPDLLRLLNNQQVNTLIRVSIASAIEILASDEGAARSLAELLPSSDIASVIYDALWVVSRRAQVRVLEKDDKIKGKKVEIEHW